MQMAQKPQRTERINIPLLLEEKKLLDEAVSLKMEKTGVGNPTEWARRILLDAVDDILEKAKKS
jgi:hypothetical protein